MPQIARTRAAGSRAPARREPAAFPAFVTLLRLYSAGSRTRPEEWSPKRRPTPSRLPRTRSSPSTSSVARWTRSTTSATCPSSRTSITYVPCPRRAVAGRPIYGKSDPPERPEGLGRGLGRRMRERGARFAGGPVRQTTSAANPRVHARVSARRDPRLHPPRARRRVPPAAPPPPIRLVLLPPPGRSESARRDKMSQFYYPLSADDASDSPRPLPLPQTIAL